MKQLKKSSILLSEIYSLVKFEKMSLRQITYVAYSKNNFYCEISEMNE